MIVQTPTLREQLEAEVESLRVDLAIRERQVDRLCRLLRTFGQLVGEPEMAEGMIRETLAD